MNDETKQFIKALYDGVMDNIELRALPSGKQVFLRSFKAMRAFCEEHEGENIYFGVATRKRNQGSKDACSYIPGYWIDVDFKKGITEVEADRMIQAGPLQPSVIVYSGNGIHLYFLLNEPRKVDKQTIPDIEGTLRRLAEYYQGDMACADVARILRLPGTLNQKYSPPRPVILIQVNDKRYNLDDFEIYGEAIEERKNPEGWDDEILKGVGEGARNESAAKLAGKYYNLGLARREILDLLESWNSRNEPPLPVKDLEVVVDSIGRRHGENHPPDLERLPSLSLSDWDQALHDLTHISKEGLKSHYEKLDKAIGGVWRDGIVFSGKPGDGKSVLSLNLAARFAGDGHRVIIFDIENDRRDIVKRLVLIILCLVMPEKSPTENGLIGEGNDLPKMLPYLEKLEAYLRNITVFSVGEQKVTPKVVDHWLKLASEEVGRSKTFDDKGNEVSKQAILFIDSINELASAYPLTKGIYESLERWLATIKGLRVKYQIPVCLICHVPKDAPVEIFSPKGSSGIAHFARTQILVNKIPRNDYDDIEVNIVRSQFGPGKERGVGFNLDRGRLRLAEGEWLGKKEEGDE